jgi:hypothetical protein
VKIIVKCDRIYFSGKKSRKILTNRHGNLISIRNDTNRFVAKEEKRKNRLKVTGKNRLGSSPPRLPKDSVLAGKARGPEREIETH